MFDVCLIPSSGQHWQTQWSYVLSHFQPRQIYCLGDLDSRVIPFRGYSSIERLSEIKKPLVVLSPKNARNVRGDLALTDFEHPNDCCYVFGSDNAPMQSDLFDGAEVLENIYIPTCTGDTMYSFVAGAVVLYDRMVMCGQSDNR